MTKTLFLPAAILTIAASTAAQLSLPTQDPILVPPNLTKLTSGEFYGNEDIHGLAIVSNRVHLIAAPETFHSIHQLGNTSWTINDFCVIKSRTDGGSDVILTVGTGGLKLTSLNAGQTNPALVPNSIVLAGGAWASASRIVANVASIPGGGMMQIAGLSGNGATVFTGTWANGIFTSGPSVTLNRAARDLALLRWDPDPVYELALMTGINQIQIRRFADLVTLTSSTASQGPGFMAVLTQAVVVPQSPPADEIAWARPSTANPPTWDLVRGRAENGGSVFLLSTPEPIVVVSPPPNSTTTTAFALKGIAAGDFNADGNDDVLAVPNTLPDWTILPQFSTALAESFRVRQENPPPLLCMPAVADFDHDGAKDLLISLEEVHEVHLTTRVFLNSPPPTDPPDILPAATEFAEYATVGNLLSLELHNLPEIAVYNRIEIATWQELYGSSGQPLGITPMAVDWREITRVGGSDQGAQVRIPSHTTETGTTLLWATKSNVWGRIRLLQVSNTDDIKKASKSYFFACGLPKVFPPTWTEWPSGYIPDLQLWDEVTRYGSSKDFGTRWTSISGGRRIWTGIAVPTQGIPPTAGGGVPTH